MLWRKELIERPILAHAEPSQEGSVWVESIESPKSNITDQLLKKTSVNQKILVKPLGHTELSNYEVDISDEPITELLKSDRDGEVTSERQFALCTGASEISVNECVAVFDLEDHKWQGLIAVLADGMVKSWLQQPTFHLEGYDTKCRVNRHLMTRVCDC